MTAAVTIINKVRTREPFSEVAAGAECSTLTLENVAVSILPAAFNLAKTVYVPSGKGGNLKL